MEHAVKKTAPPGKKTKPENDNDITFTDPVAFGAAMVNVAERVQPLLQQFMEKYEFELDENALDPMNVREAYIDFMQNLWSNPQKLAEMQMQYWQDWMNLWHQSTLRFMGAADNTAEDIYRPEKGDRRFKAPIWQDSALFDFIKQSYLLTSQWMQKAVHSVEGLDDDTRRKLEFSTRQYIDAMAPSNFMLTNPEVLQETLDTQGENLVRGFENMLEDLERGGGQLRISTTDYDAFEVGRDLAVTPGKVIYQNDLMQLIQYEAQTDKVFKRPLLIVPPWINKYYILDLKPENSLINWLVQQGHTVFTISWVNPDRKMAQKRFEDYMEDGVFDAMEQVKKVTGEDDCNMIGYCLGGTLLAITLSWLAAKKRANRIASATFLTTLIDFEFAGDMKLFMDDAQLQMLDRQMAEQGFLSADHLRRTFSYLRANDMIWSFVVNNYLMGKEPFPFDLLYWNDDATNMPAAMHSFYMRKLYRDNLLREPGGVVMNGVDIDIRKVKTPCYFLSTKEDHIAPWQATYAGTQLMSGDVTFTLAASGHVAGVINPPAKNKYCYWSANKTPAAPDDWLGSAGSHDGSWWPHWQTWAKTHAGDKVPARKIGGGKLKAIESAPGSYVKMKAD